MTTGVDGGRRFDGAIAIVTGAGSGIGRAVARRLAAEGAAVACFDIANGDATAEVISGEGGIAIDETVDITDDDAVTAAVASVVEQVGRPSVVCNVAGVGHFAWSHEEPAGEFDRIVRVNLHGTFHVCRATLPHLLDGGGVIVNTASTAGLLGQPWSAAYCASKGGVVMLTKALAIEYGSLGVRVNAVAPGGTNTNIIQSFVNLPEGADARQVHRMMSPMGYSEPEDIAATFAHIASDDARFMTGAVVTVDGGITA